MTLPSENTFGNETRAQGGALPALRNLHDLGHRGEDFLAAVVKGLSQPQKQVPAKFLYDETGSQLFERITGLPEYYPTRTEIGLLQRHSDEIAEAIGPGASLIEFGSGASRKVRSLLETLKRPAAYLAIDISREHLLDSAARLAADHPALPVFPICADYTREITLPEGIAKQGRLGFFPGSTLGNFSPTEASGFLSRVAALVGDGGNLLIGIDLRKEDKVLHAAYNDAQGVTAAFNLNLLTRLQNELGADVDPKGFSHLAHYNRARGCVEMHLVSLRRQELAVGGKVFVLEQGETIHTEDSRKFTPEAFRAQARGAGWQARKTWIDDDGLFSLHLLTTA